MIEDKLESSESIVSCEFEIELAEIPVRVPAGQYTAECLKITKVTRKEWRRTFLKFQFRLRGMGPENNVELPGFSNFPKGKCSAFSKIGRWLRIIAAYTGGRADRVSLKQFGEFLFTVKVETVTESKASNKKFSLPEAAQYEVVAEVLDIVGRLAKKATAI